MFEIANYMLVAAIFTLVGALILELVILGTVKTKATVQRSSRVKVMVGDTGADTSESALPYPTEQAAGPGGEAVVHRGLAWYATGLVIVTVALLTFYLIARFSETGHGPFANQHEYAVAFTWAILVAHLLFVTRWKLRVLALGVLPIASMLLLYGTMLDTSIRPLVPALQNSLMLTSHVAFAVLAYGAGAIAFAAAILWLLHPYMSRIPLVPSRDVLDEVGYRAAVFTFPLLTIAIILGAVWGNVAWGRYWAWDPKETASFVTWMLYGAYLHARVAHGWHGKRSAWLLIISFGGVIFTYLGNHFLGGLHSYG